VKHNQKIKLRTGVGIITPFFDETVATTDGGKLLFITPTR